MVDNSGISWHDRSPFALLTRHFFGRFFDNEFLSPGGEMVVSVTQVLALLPVPGAILSLYYIFMKYAFAIVKVHSWAAVDSWSDRCFFVSFSMIVTGLVTLLYWDTLFPDRKDYLNLVPLPLTLRTLFVAKVASLILFMGLFTVTINAASGILFPLAATMSHAAPADSMRFLAAHFVSVVSGSAFVFLLLVGIQGVCMTFLSRRLFRRVSVTIQSSLLVLFLSSFFVLSDLIVAVRGSQDPLYQHVFIPAWFTALYDRMLGLSPMHAASVSWLSASGGLAAAFALAAVFYAFSYRRYLGQFLDAPSAERNRIDVIGSIVRWLRRIPGREPEEAAAFDFVTMTLSRSPRHRMVLGSCLGVALAFCLAGVFVLITREGEAGLHRVSLTLLSIPSILCFFLLGGVRFAFAIPAELDANWVFRMGVFRPDVYWRGVRAAIWTLVLVPVFLVTLPLFTYCWGWSGGAWRFFLFEALAAVFLMERMFLDFPKIPFTCSYLPGKADLKLRWPVYVASFISYVVFTGVLAWFLTPRPRAYAVATVIGVLAIWRLMHHRRESLRSNRTIYDEQPRTELTTIFSRSSRSCLKLCRH